MCCGGLYCLAAYGIPSLCLIFKTKVAKVYVDDRGNEIENFERHVRSRAASSPKDMEQGDAQGGGGGSNNKLDVNLSAISPAPSSNPFPDRPTSADGAMRRHTMPAGGNFVPIGSTPLALSPMAGLHTPQPKVLQHATDRKKEADRQSLDSPVQGSHEQEKYNSGMLAAMSGNEPPVIDESPANIQFNLQMWIKGLIATNDSLRQDLGLPIHVKSNKKVMDLMSASHPLAISEINALVQFAQDQSEENTSLQRLLDSGGIGSEDDRTKKRPRTSPTKKPKTMANSFNSREYTIPEERSSIEGSMVSLPIVEEASTVERESRGGGGRHRSNTEGDVSLLSDPPMTSSVLPKTRRSSNSMIQDHFANQNSPDLLSKRALGHQDEKLGSQTPGPEAHTRSDKKNKTEPNFVRIAKNSGKGESLEEIAKHDKIANRKEFARRVYSQKR